MGNNCGAHTVPYIRNKNSSSIIEHEATTSKINEEQLLLLQSERIESGRSGKFNCQWFLQGGITTTANGICS